MTEQLERLIRATQGQPPSADFVAALRAQIVAETEGTGAEWEEAGSDTVSGAPVPEIEGDIDREETAVVLDIEPRPEDEDRPASRSAVLQRRQQWFAAAAAVAVGFIGIWALVATLGSDDRSLLDTATATSEPNRAGDDDDRPQLLTAGNTFVDAGTFRIDTLGSAFTFSVEETTGLIVNDNGVVMIAHLASRNADDRTITLRRTALLPDPADPTAVVDPAGGWPATDLDGWLDALDDEVKVDDRLTVTLGGAEANFAQLEFSCASPPCEAADPLAHSDLPMFTPGSRYRMWVVDQGRHDPIVVVVAVDGDDAEWFDEADAILSSLAFESIEPNPVRRIPAGAAELSVFGGISLELPEDVDVVESFDGFARVLPHGIGGDVEFLTRPLTTDGVEVTSIEQLLQLLVDEAVEVTEGNAFDVGDVEARTFDVESGPFPNIVLKTRTADLERAEFGWETPEVGHLWVVEHPDRGLLIVSAEALEGPETLESLQSWTEDLLATLDFRAR